MPFAWLHNSSENYEFIYFLTNQKVVFGNWTEKFKISFSKKFADSDFVPKFEPLRSTIIFSEKRNFIEKIITNEWTFFG